MLSSKEQRKLKVQIKKERKIQPHFGGGLFDFPSLNKNKINNKSN